MDISKPHAALLSSPGMGHLIPILELGKCLVTHHNFIVTIFAVTSPMSPAESDVIQSCMSPRLFDIMQIPLVDISGLVDTNATVVTQISVMMREARPANCSAISAWNPRPTVLIVDLFGTESLPIADELDMPKYVYVASNAWFLALTIRVPFLDKEVEGEYVDQVEPLRLPGASCRTPLKLILNVLQADGIKLLVRELSLWLCK
jgi:coniferyl-alcohol glucosyltransferase